MTQPDEKTGSFSAAAERFEDGMAHICRLYGVNPLLGRLYALLFVSVEPLSLADLCARIGAAKSTTSVVLRRLLSLRLVRRKPVRADRRDFYEVVPDFWAVLRDWNQSYFQPELAMWRRSSGELARALEAPDAPRDAGREELQARLSGLDEFVGLVADVLGTLPKGGAGGEGGPAAVTIPIGEEEPS